MEGMYASEEYLVSLIEKMRKWQVDKEDVLVKIAEQLASMKWEPKGLIGATKEYKTEKKLAERMEESLKLDVPEQFRYTGEEKKGKKKKGQIKEKDLLFLWLAQKGGGYDIETKKIREAWADSIGAMAGALKEREENIGGETYWIQSLINSVRMFKKHHKEYLEK